MGNIFNEDFRDTYSSAVVFEDDLLSIRTIHKNQLIKAKQASNRPKDLDDIQN